MAASAILKSWETPYIGRGSSYFDEIWHSDAVWPSWPFQPSANDVLMTTITKLKPQAVFQYGFRSFLQ